MQIIVNIKCNVICRLKFNFHFFSFLKGPLQTVSDRRQFRVDRARLSRSILVFAKCKPYLQVVETVDLVNFGERFSPLEFYGGVGGGFSAAAATMGRARTGKDPFHPVFAHNSHDPE